MEATDQVLTATLQEDFLDLWKEDVFEFFLWPDERQTVYFEYEISPLGVELPILIPNLGQVPRLAAVALRRAAGLEVVIIQGRFLCALHNCSWG
jgi:hypothetical protein